MDKPENADVKALLQRLPVLAVFHGALEGTPLLPLVAALCGETGAPGAAMEEYGALVRSVYESGGNFGNWLLGRVLDSDNPVVRLSAAGQKVPSVMQNALEAELAWFTALSGAAPQALAAVCGGHAVPLMENTGHDFGKIYKKRLKDAPTAGYGLFAAHHMFTLVQRGQPGSYALCPVQNPDPQRLSTLTGYEEEREKVIVNTKALLRGGPASNVLLYGDAGTGKSSTVKALANAFRGEGLRLIEVERGQLECIPRLMDDLAQNPLKFILFIDDLSFTVGDAAFTTLKAMLEGTASVRPANVVVYATSNRRHLLTQRHADRAGDELNLNDTLEEQASLSARFGLTVTFSKPDRELYQAIVLALATEYGIGMDADTLVRRAEAHAIRCGGRSPRTARQFIELLCAAN